jgi:hypothetical protein
MLIKDLEGYHEYMQNVRFRLFPLSLVTNNIFLFKKKGELLFLVMPDR